MAYDFNGTSQYFNTASTPLTAAPITMACWFYPKNTTADLSLMSITDNQDAGGNRFSLTGGGNAAGDPIRAFAQVGGSTGVADTNAGFVANAWQHACGVYSAANARTAYLNGGNSVTNTTSLSPAGVDRIRIGARFNGGIAGNFLNGQIAEVGIWSAALTAAEIASLAKGMTCDKVRPQSLVFYAPLVRDLIDAKGGRTITNNNSATVANHPRIYP
jgi:hypothetical protein